MPRSQPVAVLKKVASSAQVVQEVTEALAAITKLVAQVKKLASLPSREQMLADLGAGLQSPLGAFVGALNGLLSMFAGAIDALKTQREGA